jgi:hypothetical protein
VNDLYTFEIQNAAQFRAAFLFCITSSGDCG